MGARLSFRHLLFQTLPGNQPVEDSPPSPCMNTCSDKNKSQYEEYYLNCCNEMGLMTWPYQRVHLACSCSVLSLYSLAPSTGRRNLMTSALLKFGSLMGAAPALPIPSTIASQIPLEGAPQSNRLASSFNRWIIDRKVKIDSHNKEKMEHTARELSFLKGYGYWLS